MDCDSKPVTLDFETNTELLMLLGARDEALSMMEQELGIEGFRRVGNRLLIPVSSYSPGLEKLFLDLKKLISAGHQVRSQDLLHAVRMLRRGQGFNAVEIFSTEVNVTHKGNAIRPRTIGQSLYTAAMERQKITFCLGPAGTGKTYLAVAYAIRLLKEKSISKILLTRPVIEAGESLGFLPGEVREKVDPYFKPLYDAILDFMPHDRFLRYIERGVIEIAPLAYMRGRTLSDAFLILDEAQNTTHLQMKMFLTRIGEGSKAVITGDDTQVDLPRSVLNGLVRAESILSAIEGIEFVKLTPEDVVRHSIVQKIIMAYGEYDAPRED